MTESPEETLARYRAVLIRIAGDYYNPNPSPDSRQSADPSKAAMRRVNDDLCSEIFDELRETLEKVGCGHGHSGENTPPMFFPEWIRCALAKARLDQLEEDCKIICIYCQKGIKSEPVAYYFANWSHDLGGGDRARCVANELRVAEDLRIAAKEKTEKEIKQQDQI